MPTNWLSQHLTTCLRTLIALSLPLVLATCGGGGSTVPGAALAPPSPPAISVLTGVAAVGGPLSGVVTLRDASTTPTTQTTATASDGSFSFNVTGLTPPFALRVTWSDANGDHAMYSLSNGAGTANITPLTSLALRAAIGGADLASFFTSARVEALIAAGARMTDAVNALQAAIAPLLQRFNAQGNMLTTHFTADHSGIDAALDAILVDFNATPVTIATRTGGLPLFSAPPTNLAGGTFNAENLDRLTTGGPMSGASLYATYCAGCHGALTSSAKQGITLSRLQSAIANGTGGMGSLSSSLTAMDLESIVAALAASSPTPPPPAPTPPDGAALYTSNCAGCHGALATSSKIGVTLARLQAAISSNVGTMGFLSGVLNDAQMQAIVAALAASGPTPPPAPTPPDGAVLYATNCAGCHGSLATSSKLGATTVRIQNAISGNVGNMGSLANLTAADIQAIATALALPTPPPPPVTPDGAALYTANCAACHGPLASSSKQGISIARLQAAISANTGGMGSLSTLTVSEIQSIVTALTPTTPTPTPVLDGAVLYTQYCSSCHGALSSSSVQGRSTSLIQTAIAAVAQMNALSSLSLAQIESIAATLAGAPTGPAPACGSCHALPPGTGAHGEHTKLSCGSCHGSGYSKTTYNSATHANGVVNLVSAIGWTAATRTCSNSCHGEESWKPDN